MSARALVGALVAVVALAVPAGSGAQAPPPPPGGQAPPPQKVLEGPTAYFQWSVPERYGLSWLVSSERLRRGYVQGAPWRVMIDACGSRGGGDAITEYEIAIAGVGFDFRTGARGASCRRRFGNLPRLGTYDVTVVVRTARGSSAPRTERIELRDYLVVSLGDSMASGEGVPDVPGVYSPPYTLSKTVATLARLFSGELRFSTVRGARWRDRRCHRSARAGHSLAAWALERRDPRSSVTYLSLACSGATIANLIDKPYAGIQPPPGGSQVAAQLQVLRYLVGAGSAGSGRRVDALLLAVGVNDLGFSGIVKACAKNWNGELGGGNRDCVDSGIGLKLEAGGTLEQSFATLGDALRDRLEIAEVYVTDYPATPFGWSRGGCGFLGLPRFGIAAEEARAMASAGFQLNWVIGSAAADQRWNWVPGMTDAFAGHDYCADDSLLVPLEYSLLKQGTIHGAVHPNRAGHGVLANLLARSFVFRPDRPHWRARLVVEQVRVETAFTDPPAPPPPPPEKGDPAKPVPEPPGPDVYAFDFWLREVPNFPRIQRRRFTIPRTRKGAWINVPADAGTFELDVYDPPRPPRYPTSVNILTYGPSGTLPGNYTYAQGFGAGCHEHAHPTGWAIRYRIEVTRVDAGPGPTVPPGGTVPPCEQKVTS